MAVKATKLDSFFRGDTPLVTFQLTYQGEPIDLSGYKAFFTMSANKNPANDSDALFQRTLTPIPGAAQGIMDFYLEKADTQNADPNVTYYWDVQLEDLSTFSIVWTPFFGTFKFLTDITRTS